MMVARWMLWTGLLAAAVLSAAARAQEGRGDVIYVPTPQVVVDEMLKVAKVGPGDYVIDLGSGDGRIVITAAKKFGARGFGVDLDTYLLKQARTSAQKEGVADRAQFYERNLFETDLSPATVITSYLLPEMNEKLRPKLLTLKPGTRVVTHDYDMGEWLPDEQKVLIVPDKTVGDPGKSYIFFYIVPAAIAGQWESLIPVGGRGVIYEFEFEQGYQQVSGEVRVDGKQVRLPLFKLRGDQLSFEVDAPQAAGIVKHRFQGRIQQDAIEGTVTIGSGQKPLKWTARLKKRGALRMTAADATESVPR